MTASLQTGRKTQTGWSDLSVSVFIKMTRHIKNRVIKNKGLRVQKGKQGREIRKWLRVMMNSKINRNYKA